MIKASGFYFFSWGELWYEEFEIEATLDAIGRLINSQEKSLEGIREKFKKIIEDDPTYISLDEENKNSYYSQFFEREEHTIDEIKRLQRNSVLMTIFAFFEGRLKSICEKIEDENTLPKKLNESNGANDILKIWDYLTNVYKIDITTTEPYRKLVEQQRFARNRIVHHEGYLSKEQKKRLTLVHGLNVKDYISNSQIDITDVAFLRYLLDQITSFFKELLLAIDKRHKEINGLT